MSRLFGTDNDDEDKEHEEYLLAKCRIKGEYKEEYTYIENYYKELHGNRRYVELALRQVVQDLQRAQEEEKTVDSVTGYHTRKYADTTIKKVMDREWGHKGILRELSEVVLLVLFLILIQTLIGDSYQYSLYDRLNRLYFGMLECAAIMLVYVLVLSKKVISRLLFYKPSLMKAIRFIVYFILNLTYVSTIHWIDETPLERFCMDHLKVPLPLFIIFTLVSLSTMLIIYKSGKRARARVNRPNC